MAQYVCKRDPQTKKVIATIGVVVIERKGYIFLSRVASHGDGRKHRDTALAAVPPWVFKEYANVVLLSRQEFVLADGLNKNGHR